MRIVTSKGTEHDVDWIDPPITQPNLLLLQMLDDRPLAQIASEFDGVETIERFDENQGDKVFTGYTALRQIALQGGGVQIILERPGEGA